MINVWNLWNTLVLLAAGFGGDLQWLHENPPPSVFKWTSSALEKCVSKGEATDLISGVALFGWFIWKAEMS